MLVSGETIVNTFKLIAALEAHILTSSGGWENDKALAEFRQLARDLMRALDRSECSQRLEYTCDLAEMFYSTRRHRRWDRGAAHVRNAIVAHIASIRDTLAAT
jgi:copper oxidase (laccase) domain-containing protein